MSDFRSMPRYEPGIVVEKATGYRFTGVIVSSFYKLNGDLRYVVESTAVEAEGLLFIFAEKQIVPKGQRTDA